jgi:hypothetical protein
MSKRKNVATDSAEETSSHLKAMKGKKKDLSESSHHRALQNRKKPDLSQSSYVIARGEASRAAE